MFPVNFLRRFWHVCERVPGFLVAVFSSKGIFHRDGRKLIRGKFRRFFLSFFPSVARRIQRHYGLSGGCVSCGGSCNLLFRCPHWDPKSRLCTVYDDRPTICRTFPITPKDLEDRAIANPNEPCGFVFTKK